MIWEKVYRTDSISRATIIAGVLNENNIPCNVLDKKDSSYVFLGHVDLMVPNNLMKEAEALIATLDLQENHTNEN
jgi:hypothetical protein